MTHPRVQPSFLPGDPQLEGLGSKPRVILELPVEKAGTLVEHESLWGALCLRTVLQQAGGWARTPQEEAFPWCCLLHIFVRL